MTPAFWRRWHRWIGFPASIFLLFASITGFLVAGTEFFGEAEALRERTRDLVSPVTTGSPAAAWSDPVQKALAAVTAQGGNMPVDKIEMQFKGDDPTVTIFTGKPTGGEDRKFVVAAKTGEIVSTGVYADKPLLYRLHSGEAFGDGGLVVDMAWGLCIALLTISGLLIYWRMRRRGATGIKRYFW